jgi:DNA-binding NarL/FixJ family response regulator
MSAATQLQSRSRLESLETVVAEAQETGGEIYLLHDVLSNDSEDPGTKAARKMDWSEFASALTERERAVVDCIVEGRSLRDAAKSFRVCDSTMQGDKRKLAIKILDWLRLQSVLLDLQRQHNGQPEAPQNATSAIFR